MVTNRALENVYSRPQGVPLRHAGARLCVVFDRIQRLAATLVPSLQVTKSHIGLAAYLGNTEIHSPCAYYLSFMLGRTNDHLGASLNDPAASRETNAGKQNGLACKCTADPLYTGPVYREYTGPELYRPLFSARGFPHRFLISRGGPRRGDVSCTGGMGEKRCSNQFRIHISLQGGLRGN